MSQEKVNRYKEYKKNKDKIIKHEKTMKRLEATVASVIAVAFAAWFCWSIYNSATTKEDASTPVVTEIVSDAYTDYLSSLQSTFTAD